MAILSKLSKILDESLKLVTNSLEVMNESLEEVKYTQKVEIKERAIKKQDYDVIEGEFTKIDKVCKDSWLIPNTPKTKALPASNHQPVSNHPPAYNHRPAAVRTFNKNTKKITLVGDNHFCSYDEWQKMGYQVKKGAKAYRKYGQAIFYRSQVVPKKNYDTSDEVMYDDDIPF